MRRVAGPYYARSRGVREVVAAARWPALRKELPDLAHLVRHDETAWGPVQRDEALFLHALVRVLRPSTVVEIGFLHGDSAFNLLRALDADARLYSFDIDPAAESVAQRERFRRDSRFVFRRRSQADLTAEDMDGRQPDLVFLDASHDLELNEATFSRVAPADVSECDSRGTRHRHDPQAARRARQDPEGARRCRGLVACESGCRLDR